MAIENEPPPTVWLVDALFAGETAWSTRLVQAHAATQWGNGGLHLYDRGPKNNSPKRTVLMLAPGQWRACEPFA